MYVSVLFSRVTQNLKIENIHVQLQGVKEELCDVFG
jgi:hypothetical protein